MRAFASAVFLFLALGAQAQDLSLFAGVTQSEAPSRRTYGLMVQYAHDLGPNLFASYGYMNEGHVPGHHRDGHTVQAWMRTTAFAPELSLAAGVGPYRYFDTTVAESGSFANAHGWGVMASFAARWRAGSSPWSYELRVNHTEARSNIDTTMLLAGITYHAEQDASFARRSGWSEWSERREEVVVLGGQTIVNSFESERAAARSVEYRHTFGPVLRGSVAWLSEGDARLVRRNGLVTQGWLEPSFYGNRFTLGFGLGGYYAVDSYQARSHRALGIVTTTMSYHFSRGWVARFSWHRISSNYDRDSDILLLGMGYRF